MQIKKPSRGKALSKSKMRSLFELGVAVAEFVHATSCIYQLLLPCIEGMRVSGDLHLHQRIFNAVHLDRVPGVGAGTRNELIACSHVLEYTKAVVVWMNVFSHDERFTSFRRAAKIMVYPCQTRRPLSA